MTIHPPKNKTDVSFHDISLRPLCKADLDALAPRLRAADAAELRAAYGVGPRQALEICLRRSARAWGAFCGAEICAAFGAAPQTLLGTCACAWLMTAQEVEKHPKSFWKASRAAAGLLKSFYPNLYAVCDGRYQAAQRYLRRLGARREGAGFTLADGKTLFYLYRF